MLFRHHLCIYCNEERLWSKDDIILCLLDDVSNPANYASLQ